MDEHLVESLEVRVRELEKQLEIRDRQLLVIQKHLERAAQSLLSASKVEKREQPRRLP